MNDKVKSLSALISCDRISSRHPALLVATLRAHHTDHSLVLHSRFMEANELASDLDYNSKAQYLALLSSLSAGSLYARLEYVCCPQFEHADYLSASSALVNDITNIVHVLLDHQTNSTPFLHLRALTLSCCISPRLSGPVAIMNLPRRTDWNTYHRQGRIR